MTKIFKKISIALLLLTAGSVLLSACYEKFDPESYQPKFTISGYAAVDEIEPESLVGYFSLDGSLTDSESGSAGENAGTTFVNGFKGQAISLNVNEKTYVTFAPGSTITGLESFTISFWVNPTFVDTNADNGIDGILGFVNLGNTGSFWGNIDWFVENGSNPNAAKIVAHITSGASETWMSVDNYKGLFGTWSNHTLTYDAGTSTFVYYINGSIAKTATAGWTGAIGFTNSADMVFGAVHFMTIPSQTSSHGAESWASYLTGSMDEIRIYDSALSGEDVNALVVLQGKGK